MTRAASLALLLAAALSAAGCAARDPRTRGPERDAAAVIGIYRGRIENVQGESHRFRLLLYAARPDRLHGELLGPLGAPQMIVDGGGGRLAVTLPRRGAAYVGTADPRHVRDALGVELRLEQLVSALLDGVLDVAGYALVREGAARGLLPETLEVVSRESSLRLVLYERRALGGSAERLGTGSPPEGLAIHPLEDLAPGDIPGREPESGPS